MRFEKNITERKALATRMEELTGISKEYTGVPRCAYIIRPFTVERDGHIEVEEGSLTGDNIQVIRTMLEEGMITGSLPDTTEGTEESTEAAENAEPEETEGALTQTPAEAGTDPSEPEDRGAEPMMSAADFLEENGINTTDLVKPNIAFPLTGHTPRSIRNLVSLLYSRGALISKATDGEFSVAEGLVEKLKDSMELYSIEKLRKQVEDYETENGPSITGLSIERDRLVFTGFPATANPEEIQVFMQLAGVMNRQAIEQHNIQAKNVDGSNEKYAMRTWLIRIGMKGTNFKKARMLLMERLSGHTAFRTKADADRWREKQKQKRAELKEAKATA